jgi:putative transposase
LAGRVLLKIVYLLVRRLLGLAVLVLRKDLAKDAGLLVLRHENAVLRRHAGRIRYEPADRVWLAALALLIPRRRWSEIFPSRPRRCWPGTANWPQENTTRAGGANPAARR